MKCYKGSILSINPTNQVFKYLVEDAGRIIYTADELPAKFAEAEMIDLGE